MNRQIPYTLISKPVGPVCNLDCTYCFYLEKKKLYGPGTSFSMSSEVVESYIKQRLCAADQPEVQFVWQGGEPTLLGVEFFQNVVELQKQFADGRRVTNAFQTNGILLDEQWCEFFKENEFLVGISIDGPKEIHDAYRLDKLGRPTFNQVVQACELMKVNQVPFNTLVVINNINSKHPLELYQFLKHVGDAHIQFIPLVERQLNQTKHGLSLAPPNADNTEKTAPKVTSWSVKPNQFAEFYIKIFDAWVRNDVGSIFVQFFDVALGNWGGVGSSLCHFAPSCGNPGVLEHNGDLYSCDHYVYPNFKLGNIMSEPLDSLMALEKHQQFSRDKLDTLPQYCLDCSVRFACNGDCPKHRFKKSPTGEQGLSYLCPAYKKIFTHMDPYMQVMAELIGSGREAGEIMSLIAEQDKQLTLSQIGRNDPCPCGSGKKMKKCCGAKA